MVNMNNRKWLKRTLDIEYALYFCNRTDFIRKCVLYTREYRIWRYQRALRYLEFYKKEIIHNNSLLNKILFSYYSRMVNKTGLRLGVDAWCNVFREGLLIYHVAGGIIVNSEARIGKNCHLHGNNCIGNNGSKNGKSPVIGDNCTLGIGAKVLGDIKLGNNITVGAGAVVIESCLEDGAVLVGIPAKKVQKLSK